MFKVSVIIVDYLLVFFIAFVTVLIISSEVDANNSSDSLGKVISIRSEQQIGGNNNVNTTLLVSTPVDTTNSSDMVGKVMPTKNKEQIGVDSNINTVLKVPPSIDVEDSSDTVKATETGCKEQTGSKNLNTTNLPCVNRTMSLQNIGNEKKRVQSETKVMDKTNLTTSDDVDQNDRNIFNAPAVTTEPPVPCPSPNETRTVLGDCTILY